MFTCVRRRPVRNAPGQAANQMVMFRGPEKGCQFKASKPEAQLHIYVHVYIYRYRRAYICCICRTLTLCVDLFYMCPDALPRVMISLHEAFSWSHPNPQNSSTPIKLLLKHLVLAHATAPRPATVDNILFVFSYWYVCKRHGSGQTAPLNQIIAKTLPILAHWRSSHGRVPPALPTTHKDAYAHA